MLYESIALPLSYVGATRSVLAARTQQYINRELGSGEQAAAVWIAGELIGARVAHVVRGGAVGAKDLTAW